MRPSIIVILLVGLPIILSAQIQNAEMTTYWQDIEETLIPDEGLFPPETDISSSSYLGRLRLQNTRNFPVFEARYMYRQNHNGGDIVNLRLAGIHALPIEGLTAKGVFIENNPDDSEPMQELGVYLFYSRYGFDLGLGMDYEDAQGYSDKIYSLRAKYALDRFKLMGRYLQPIG